MDQFAFRGGRPLARRRLPTPVVEEVLSPEALEHGGYYAGKLGAKAAIARWHARKRRFVFGEYALGRERVRSVAHVADDATGEWFSPVARTEPQPVSRISDYAFETAG